MLCGLFPGEGEQECFDSYSYKYYAYNSKSPTFEVFW